MSGGRPIPCPDEECADDWGYLSDFWPLSELSHPPVDLTDAEPSEDVLIGYCERCGEPGIVYPPRTINQLLDEQ